MATDSSEERKQQLLWYKARDTILGMNCRQQAGVQMVRSCCHKDALWMAEVFTKGIPVGYEAAKGVLMKCNQDGRALCFAGLIARQMDVPLVRAATASRFGIALAQGALAAVTLEIPAKRLAFAALLGPLDADQLYRAAQQGDPMAQGLISEQAQFDEKKRTKYAKLAALKKDARGLFNLAALYENRIGEEKKGLDLYRQADWLPEPSGKSSEQSCRGQPSD